MDYALIRRGLASALYSLVYEGASSRGHQYRIEYDINKAIAGRIYEAYDEPTAIAISMGHKESLVPFFRALCPEVTIYATDGKDYHNNIKY